MILVYNPQEGVPIPKEWNHNGFQIPVDLLPFNPGMVLQFPDDFAHALMETFEFLREITADEAARIKELPDALPFLCKYCDKSFRQNIGLVGHMRSHKAEIEAESKPVVDPKEIPVVTMVPVSQKQSGDEKDYKKDIENGPDRDGVHWYGDGLVIDKDSQRPVSPIGEKGHFGA